MASRIEDIWEKNKGMLMAPAKEEAVEVLPNTKSEEEKNIYPGLLEKIRELRAKGISAGDIDKAVGHKITEQTDKKVFYCDHCKQLKYGVVIIYMEEGVFACEPCFEKVNLSQDELDLAVVNMTRDEWQKSNTV